MSYAKQPTLNQQLCLNTKMRTYCRSPHRPLVHIISTQELSSRAECVLIMCVSWMVADCEQWDVQKCVASSDGQQHSRTVQCAEFFRPRQEHDP